MAGARAWNRRGGGRYCARGLAVRAGAGDPGTVGGFAAQWRRDAGASGRGCALATAAAAITTAAAVTAAAATAT